MKSSETILKGKELLLKIKDSDLRIDTLIQCETAIDGGIHIGGAFSALIPMISLFYGSNAVFCPDDPTSMDQDIFILSKGHAIAALASVYADLGYIDRSMLYGSRSIDSILNGHPGPILPGVQVSTGPLGHGLSVACGFAEGLNEHDRNIYCLTGDGELQEGSNWEAILYAGAKRLRRICMIVDMNNGQSDDTSQLVVSLGDLERKLSSFDWNVLVVDGTSYSSVTKALVQFQTISSEKPTAIISNCVKGQGGFSELCRNHKINMSKKTLDSEKHAQEERRACREKELCSLINANAVIRQEITTLANKLNYTICFNDAGDAISAELEKTAKSYKKPKERKNQLQYQYSKLPLEFGKAYGAHEIVASMMEQMGMDSRVYTIDSDLSGTSGFHAGLAKIDSSRALNAGISECHMMCMGEGLAALGNNVWMSTFCVFFDWRALRRILISYQERQESINDSDGWLSDGWNLNMTFLATASNLDTQTNGATHMGNDDIMVFSQLPYVKIIDVSCPRQLENIMKWIGEGDRGIVYLRVMRSPAKVIYEYDFEFAYGKGYYAKKSKTPQAVIISSGRGVHEALDAYEQLSNDNISVDVLDMPSFDEETIEKLIKEDSILVFAEQNNGYLLQKYSELIVRKKISVSPDRVLWLNTKNDNDELRFIHSGTYAQLTKYCKVDSESIVNMIKSNISSRVK